MNLTASARATPFGAVITPTRSTDLHSQLRRLFDRLRDAWMHWQASRRAAEDAMRMDAATLRDLGLSHAAALRGREDAFAERRP